MDLNLDTNWALKKGENKIKPNQIKHSKLEWEYNIKLNPIMWLWLGY